MKILRTLVTSVVVVVFLFTSPLSALAKALVDKNYDVPDAGQLFGKLIYEFLYTGKEAYYDSFPHYAEDLGVYSYAARPDEEPGSLDEANIAGVNDEAFKFKNTVVKLPLVKKDYYYGKYTNGKAGAVEINRVPVLKPSDNVGLIRDGYLTLSPRSGYVKPPGGYYYGSGLCWAVSALGQLMDEANKEFQAKYGIPLFVFSGRDRAPHPSYYSTYNNSNGGRGYTVIKIGRNGGQDYRFTINPKLASRSQFKDMRLKIVMTYTNTSTKGMFGQQIGAVLYSNKDF